MALAENRHPKDAVLIPVEAGLAGLLLPEALTVGLASTQIGIRQTVERLDVANRYFQEHRIPNPSLFASKGIEYIHSQTGSPELAVGALFLASTLVAADLARRIRRSLFSR